MRSLLLGLVVLGALSCQGPRPEILAPPNLSLHYELRVDSPADELVRVRMELSPLPEQLETLVFHMASQYAYVSPMRPLFEQSPSFSGRDGEALRARRIGTHRWQVETEGHAAVIAEYSVPLQHRKLPEVAFRQDQYEHPYLAADHGLLATATLIMAPIELQPARIRVRFELPPDWPVVTAWPQVAPFEFSPRSWRSLMNDLVAIGHWTRQSVAVDGFEAVIAVAPGNVPAVDRFIPDLMRIVRAELRLFDTRPVERFLLLFGRPDGQGAGGSPKAGAMTLYLAPSLAAQASQRLSHLIAHEFFHLWASSRYLSPPELRWVNEGFTDYFAHLVNARLGLTSWDDFTEALGEAMASCESNPQLGKLSLKDAGGDPFFQDRDAYDLVYRGGLLLAAWVDRSIAEQRPGKRLEHFMRELNNDPQWERGGPTPSLEEFLARLTGYLDQRSVARVRSFVEKPYYFDPVVEFGALGIPVARQTDPWDLVLRAHLEGGNQIQDLDRRGGGYQFGLRAGDRILSVNDTETETENDVRSALLQTRNGRLQITVDRAGTRRVLEDEVPQRPLYLLDSRVWAEF